MFYINLRVDYYEWSSLKYSVLRITHITPNFSCVMQLTSIMQLQYLSLNSEIGFTVESVNL